MLFRESMQVRAFDTVQISLRMTSKPEVIGSSVGLVPTNALVLPEPISGDRPVEISRRRRLSHQQTYASYCARPERRPMESS